MFNYIVLLYHVTWPGDYLTYNIVALFSVPDTDILSTDT